MGLVATRRSGAVDGRIDQPPSHVRSLLIALVCYASISAWFHWDLLRAPGQALPQPIGLSETYAALQWGDEQMVAATIGTVARRLVTAPWRIHDLGQCYPFPDSLTLGEPMFVDALVGALPMAVTGSPIVAKNVVTISAPVLGAIFMFALVLYWTGSFWAALLAGLLFGFEPARLTDVSHPYVHGNVWSPLALLAAHRLFARQRWLDAALLATALALQMLESFYPALALALVGGAYGGALAVHHRRLLPALLPKLTAVVLFVAGVGAVAFRPYFANRDTWKILGGRASLLLEPSQFYFGGPSYLGSVLLILATIALWDRLRRGTGIVFDPRLPLLAGGALVYWFVVEKISIPLVGSLPSPYLLGLKDLPGVSAVRVVSAVRCGLPFAGACLAGLGMAALLRQRGSFGRRTLGTLVVALAFGEIFFFPASGQGFGIRLRTVPVAPSKPLLALLDALPLGPVLDFPPSKFVPPSTHYVLLHGFHDRATDACHSSFPSPMREKVYALSARLPDSAAALELRSLGFRGIVVHTEFLMPPRREAFFRWARGDGRRSVGLHELGEADGHVVYAFAPAPTPAGFEALSLPALLTDEPVQTLATAGQPLRLTIHNMQHRFYAHPDPIRPSRVVLAWVDGTGSERASEPVTALLPLVLPPMKTEVIEVIPEVLPPPGLYTVMLRLHDARGPVVARQPVSIPPTSDADRPEPSA